MRQFEFKLYTLHNFSCFRLSQAVAVKLQDNNPNIVDLSDQYRPTKLAEMFNELYDNEWTNVVSAMQETFDDRQLINLLLQTVMVRIEYYV